MKDYRDKKIVLYSLINGVGSTTIAYQLARLLRLPLYQEKKSDLVQYLKTVLDPNRYTVKLISEVTKNDYKNGAIYDLDTVDKKIFNLSTDIIVLTNNSFIDILKTIATLQQIKETVLYKDHKVHVVFNRLQNGNVEREKKYTKESIELINSQIDLNITYSYIRTNLIYYAHIADGRFFMDYFFRNNASLITKYPELRDVEHTEHLKILFNKQYRNINYSFLELDEYEDTINSIVTSYDELKKHEIIMRYMKKKDRKISDRQPKICEIIHEEFVDKVYHKENIKNAKVVFKDMFTLLYNLDIYEDDEVDKKLFKDQNNER